MQLRCRELADPTLNRETDLESRNGDAIGPVWTHPSSQACEADAMTQLASRERRAVPVFPRPKAA